MQKILNKLILLTGLVFSFTTMADYVGSDGVYVVTVTGSAQSGGNMGAFMPPTGSGIGGIGTMSKEALAARQKGEAYGKCMASVWAICMQRKQAA